MGAACCKPEDDEMFGRGMPFKRPKWRSEEPMTQEELDRLREQFWDTEPHYGGDKVIWDALKAACESDLETAKLIIESAGIIVATNDMSVCYDERGAKYQIPRYCLSFPLNLIKSSASKGSSTDIVARNQPYQAPSGVVRQRSANSAAGDAPVAAAGQIEMVA